MQIWEVSSRMKSYVASEPSRAGRGRRAAAIKARGKFSKQPLIGSSEIPIQLDTAAPEPPANKQPDTPSSIINQPIIQSTESPSPGSKHKKKAGINIL